MLESLGEQHRPDRRGDGGTYAHGAPTLAKFAARQAPVDLDARDRAARRRRGGDPASGRRRARARALDLSAFVQYPEQFLPVAFFSELPPELFPRAIQLLRLVRAGDGDVVFREGEPGSAFYFVAAGEVRVVARAGNNKAPSSVELTRLLEGALFGEMALMTDQPRTASDPGGGRGRSAGGRAARPSPS